MEIRNAAPDSGGGILYFYNRPQRMNRAMSSTT